MREIDRRSVGSKRAGIWSASLPRIPVAVVALSVCWADYTLAASARTAATAIDSKFKELENTMWFFGHWGFQYYMEAKEARAIDVENMEVSPGDIIVVPENNATGFQLPRNIVRKSEMFEFFPCRWLATMNGRLGAGFYTDRWGPLPFAVGRVGPEKYYAFTVK